MSLPHQISSAGGSIGKANEAGISLLGADSNQATTYGQQSPGGLQLRSHRSPFPSPPLSSPPRYISKHRTPKSSRRGSISGIAHASLIADALEARTPKDLVAAESRIWSARLGQQARRSKSDNILMGRRLREKFGETMTVEEEMKQTLEVVLGGSLDDRQEGMELGIRAKSGKNSKRGGVGCRELNSLRDSPSFMSGSHILSGRPGIDSDGVAKEDVITEGARDIDCRTPAIRPAARLIPLETSLEPNCLSGPPDTKSSHLSSASSVLTKLGTLQGNAPRRSARVRAKSAEARDSETSKDTALGGDLVAVEKQKGNPTAKVRVSRRILNAKARKRVANERIGE